MQDPKLEALVQRDTRYAYEAYEFVYLALEHTERLLAAPGKAHPPNEEQHFSGRQLLEGIRHLALQEFGLMARTVFRMWGINKTDDFGEIVFNLVEANLMSKTDHDDRADFRDVFDLDEVLVESFTFHQEPEKGEEL